jgi:hypothetical protein
MNVYKLTTMLVCIGILTGCGPSKEERAALEDGIPLVNIIKEPNGNETVLSGKIQPRMNFTSSFSARSDSGVECSGEFNNRGAGTVSCTNGWKLNLQIPQELYGTLNGSYIETVDGIGSAVGWGSQADAALLRTLM